MGVFLMICLSAAAAATKIAAIPGDHQLPAARSQKLAANYKLLAAGLPGARCGLLLSCHWVRSGLVHCVIHLGKQPHRNPSGLRSQASLEPQAAALAALQFLR